ncbi:MAG: hypothetical protein WD066_12305 [Planctomycetaceae bacterium]
MLFTRKVRIVALVVLIVGLAAGGWAYRNHHRYKHFQVHDPGLVYRSAWLEADVLDEVIETYQFRTVVNLCYQGEKGDGKWEMGEARWEEERRVVANAGAKLIELPMPFTIDADDPWIRKHIDVMRDPDNYPMLVHCQHGVTRTDKFLAIYDILFRGLTAEESLNAQPLFGRDDHNVHVWAFARLFERERDNILPRHSANPRDVLRR